MRVIDLLGSVSYAEHCAGTASAARSGLHGHYHGAPILETAQELLAIARAGLLEQAGRPGAGSFGIEHLSILEDIVDSGLTIAGRAFMRWPDLLHSHRQYVEDGRISI
jgi:gamma-glutamylcysteine synthetase